MSAPWSICRGEEARPPEEPSRPAAEEATIECSGSRGREVRGWRPEVEQQRGRGERASAKKGPPVWAGWFCRQNAGGENHDVALAVFFRVEIRDIKVKTTHFEITLGCDLRLWNLSFSTFARTSECRS
jgi:hypothetical protein